MLSPSAAGRLGLPGVPEVAATPAAAAVTAAGPPSGTAAVLHAAPGSREGEPAVPFSRFRGRDMEHSLHALPTRRAEAGRSPSQQSLSLGEAIAGAPASDRRARPHSGSHSLHSSAGQAGPGGLPHWTSPTPSDTLQVWQLSTCLCSCNMRPKLHAS